MGPQRGAVPKSVLRSGMFVRKVFTDLDLRHYGAGSQ